MASGVKVLCGGFCFLIGIAICCTGSAIAQNSNISGKVTEAGSGLPIAGIYVTGLEVNFGFMCTGGSPHQPHTNTAGQYTLSCPPGKYKILFRSSPYYVMQWYNQAPSYASAQQVEINGWAATGINAVMNWTGGGQITGKVVDQEGVGIQGARVYVYDPDFYSRNLSMPDIKWSNKFDWPYFMNWYNMSEDMVYFTATDNNGDYFVSNLSPGNYKLHFSVYNKNYLPEWWDDKGNFGTANSVAVTAGGTTVANAQLSTGGGISGNVRDGAHNPLANARITVYDQHDTWRSVAWAIADANGDYTAVGLPAGEYLVKFQGPYGLDYAFEWYPDRFSSAEAQSVKVYAGQMCTGIDAQLEGGWTIQGTINPDLNGAWATAYDPGKNKVASGASDQNGHYTIRELRDGKYKILFNKEGYAFQWYNNKRTWETADEVAMGGGGVVGINAKLELEAGLEGNVSAAAGPIPKVRVKIYDAALEQLILASVTNSWGDFVLRQLPAGDGKIYYDSLGTCFLPEWWYNQKDFGAAIPVTFIPFGTTYVIDQLDPAHCLRLPMILKQ